VSLSSTPEEILNSLPEFADHTRIAQIGKRLNQNEVLEKFDELESILTSTQNEIQSLSKNQSNLTSSLNLSFKNQIEEAALREEVRRKRQEDVLRLEGIHQSIQLSARLLA